MRGAKQGLAKRLKLSRVLLDLRSEHVGEQVAAHISHELPVLIKLLAAALGVALEIGLNPKQRREVVNETAAATENVETAEAGHLRVDVNKREPHRYFGFGVFLPERGHGYQKDEP